MPSDKFKVLYGLHREVVATSSAKRCQLMVMYTDGKPDIVLTVNELGLKGHDYVYRIFGSDGQKAYSDAVKHLRELLEVKTA